MKAAKRRARAATRATSPSSVSARALPPAMNVNGNRRVDGQHTTTGTAIPAPVAVLSAAVAIAPNAAPSAVQSAVQSAAPRAVQSAGGGTILNAASMAVGATPAIAIVPSGLARTASEAPARYQRDWTAEILVRGLGGVLLWAGVSKAASGVAFLAALNAYELPLPRGVLAAIAVVLPWVEILSGWLLATRTRVGSALLLSLLMTVGFCLATGQAVLRGLDISCGCLDLDFLAHSPWPNAQKILESVGAAFVRNLAMLGGILFLFARHVPNHPTPR